MSLTNRRLSLLIIVLFVVSLVFSVIVTPCSGISSSSEPGSPEPHIVALSMGEHHTLALMSDGTVWAWGINVDGQCGVPNTTTLVLTPVEVPNLTNVKAVAVTMFYSIALRSDGTVWTWGASINPTIGHEGDNPSPTMLPLSNITAIAAGEIMAWP
jgi:alpha-tubulin suppressor-like RCC1 family protein